VILEDQPSAGIWRCELRQPTHPKRLAMNAFGAAIPLDRDAQLFQRLLDYPGLAAWPLDQHGTVGNATGQISNQRLLSSWDMPRAPQVGQQRVGPFDIKLCVHAPLIFPTQQSTYAMFRRADLIISASVCFGSALSVIARALGNKTWMNAPIVDAR
jgi:hypothetical protein